MDQAPRLRMIGGLSQLALALQRAGDLPEIHLFESLAIRITVIEYPSNLLN
jgi:hypothetical protein